MVKECLFVRFEWIPFASHIIRPYASQNSDYIFFARSHNQTLSPGGKFWENHIIN